MSNTPLDKDGNTPLHMAVSEGNAKKVRDLIKGGFFTKGADVHAKNDGGKTPLDWAAHSGHKEAVQVLLTKGADVHAKDNSGWTPLHSAASQGRTETAQVLITHRADVNATDKFGKTPLHLAANSGHKETMQVLLTNGADVNAKKEDNWAPLHYAATRDHKEIAQFLITKGADVHGNDKIGRTPLDLARSDAMREILTKQQQGQQHPLPAKSPGGNASGSNQGQMPQSVESLATIAQMQRDDPSIQQPQQEGAAAGVVPPAPCGDPQPSPPVAGSGSTQSGEHVLQQVEGPPPLAGPPRNNAATQPQRQLSDFTIDFNSTLGAGGSATVYKAFDNVTNKPVAVKVQPVGRLDAEAKLLTQLKHPNIVQVLFFDDGGGSSAAAGPPASKLFLELVDGGSLDKVIESSAPLPEEEIRRYLSSILQALDCVHNQSPPVFHRDVKPANMLLAKDGTLKLTDFGCARVQGKTGTTATLIAGTWVCLAPEACLGKPCAASDLWATACSVLHMATGRTPWHETGLKDVTLAAHISKPNPPLNHYPTVPQSLSAPLQALLRKMFAHNPEDRGTAATHLKDPYFANEIPSNPPPTAGGGSDSAVASVFPQWLQGIPVPDDVRATLLQHRVDEMSFELLDVDDLKEMGVAIGPRKILLNEIAKRKAE